MTHLVQSKYRRFTAQVFCCTVALAAKRRLKRVRVSLDNLRGVWVGFLSEELSPALHTNAERFIPPHFEKRI